VQPEGDGDRDRQCDRPQDRERDHLLSQRRWFDGIRVLSWSGDLQVNRQASLCDEFGGAPSSK
jgi:hypothetical protein